MTYRSPLTFRESQVKPQRARTITSIREQSGLFRTECHLHLITFSVSYDAKCLGSPAFRTTVPLETQLRFPRPSVSGFRAGDIFRALSIRKVAHQIYDSHVWLYVLSQNVSYHTQIMILRTSASLCILAISHVILLTFADLLTMISATIKCYCLKIDSLPLDWVKGKEVISFHFTTWNGMKPLLTAIPIKYLVKGNQIVSFTSTVNYLLCDIK